ncbi:MAG: Fe-S protein assembly chaperone HscA [Burkholderiaceae bacterium]
MALLQISEPGMAPAPHQRRLAVGIDLGTTNSLVAAVRSGVAEVLPDEHGRVLLPSAVHYRGDGTAGIGHDALAQRAADPRNTIVSVKRLMGRGRDDLDEAMRYDLADVSAGQPGGGLIRLSTAAGVKTPVEVSAEILATLRQRAEDTLGDDLVGAVITVPAYFDDAQRQATKDAAQLAGINVLRLLNEPTAAAVAYGLDNGIEGTYAVYDLGGGTFDLSILRLTHGVFEVLATGGDTALGGDDFDERLSGLALKAAGVTTDLLSDAEHASLAAYARAAKEELSDALVVDLAFEAAGVHRHAAISRDAFASATADLVDRTLAAATRGLRDAKLAATDVAGVVMVGGATRMPQVRAAVERYFGKPPLVDLDPDRVVALGAAMQAHALAGNRAVDGEEWLLLDVIPLSLGVETMGGLAEKIIARNSTIPVARAQEFTTFKDGQTAMAIHVVQGERELVSDCRSLARFELRGIPPMTAGAARIRVTYQVDADGLLSVTATELTSKVEAHIAVKPSYGLGDDEVARMLKESFGAADSDMRMRALREQQVEAQRIVAATESALAADAALLDAHEIERIRCRIDAVRRVAEGDDHSAIKDAIDALSHGTERFAELRMDASVRRALAGKRLDEIA